jgi:hypothetical protein
LAQGASVAKYIGTGIIPVFSGFSGHSGVLVIPACRLFQLYRRTSFLVVLTVFDSPGHCMQRKEEAHRTFSLHCWSERKRKYNYEKMKNQIMKI